MLPAELHINWPFGSGEEAKNRFSRWPPWRPTPWRPSLISDRNDFSYFYLHGKPMLPTKIQVSWPFGSGEETKNRFLRWISDRNDFSYF